MSASLENKKQVVESIKAKISESKSVVLIDYKGLTVAQDTELRNEFRKAGVEYKVLKNTLIRKAFNDLGVTDFDEDLKGPTSVAFGEDETVVAPTLEVEVCAAGVGLVVDHDVSPIAEVSQGVDTFQVLLNRGAVVYEHIDDGVVAVGHRVALGEHLQLWQN